MELITITIGVGITAFLFLYLALNLDENQKVLQVLAVGMFLLSLFVLGSGSVGSAQVCEIVLNETNEFDVYTYGNNINGTVHWDENSPSPMAGNPPSALLDPPVLFHRNLTIQNSYMLSCFDTGDKTGLQHFRIVNWFMILMIAYIGYFLLFSILNWIKEGIKKPLSFTQNFKVGRYWRGKK